MLKAITEKFYNYLKGDRPTNVTERTTDTTKFRMEDGTGLILGGEGTTVPNAQNYEYIECGGVPLPQNAVFARKYNHTVEFVPMHPQVRLYYFENREGRLVERYQTQQTEKPVKFTEDEATNAYIIAHNTSKSSGGLAMIKMSGRGGEGNISFVVSKVDPEFFKNSPQTRVLEQYQR